MPAASPGGAASAASPDAAWRAALAIALPLCRGRDVLLLEAGVGAGAAAAELLVAGAQRAEVMALEPASAGGRAWDLVLYVSGPGGEGRARALAALVREGGLLVAGGQPAA